MPLLTSSLSLLTNTPNKMVELMVIDDILWLMETDLTQIDHTPVDTLLTRRVARTHMGVHVHVNESVDTTVANAILNDPQQYPCQRVWEVTKNTTATTQNSTDANHNKQTIKHLTSPCSDSSLLYTVLGYEALANIVDVYSHECNDFIDPENTRSNISALHHHHHQDTRHIPNTVVNVIFGKKTAFATDIRDARVWSILTSRNNASRLINHLRLKS